MDYISEYNSTVDELKRMFANGKISKREYDNELRIASMKYYRESQKAYAEEVERGYVH